jgi:VWFA-related protein
MRPRLQSDDLSTHPAAIFLRVAPVFAGAALALCGLSSQSQSPASTTAQNPSLTSRSTLVLIPALVRNQSAELVYTLTARDFVLTDDGIPQKLTLEPDTGGEPLALVVDLEVGGAGTREFDKLGALTPMLESIVGSVPHRIAVVGFDSEPALVRGFTSDTDVAAAAILGLAPGCSREHHMDDCKSPTAVHNESLGDDGAAILDSLAFSVDLLRKQPPQYRRAILLISETLDRGSKITLEESVRAISDTNTAIYSIGFSTAKSEAAHYANKQLPTGASTWPTQGNPLQPGSFEFFGRQNHDPNPPNGCMGKTPDPSLPPDPDATHSRLSQAFDCAGQLLPPLILAKLAAIAAYDGLQQNIPETVARLTGGEYFKLTGSRSLERNLHDIANHLPNRYVLSFQPQSPHPGFHAISLTLKDYPDLSLAARRGYWATAESPAPDLSH